MIMGCPAIVECLATAGCPTHIRFCGSTTCFKYLLPSSEILCCPAWVACQFLLLAFFANCMVLNASSSLKYFSSQSSSSWKCNCSSNQAAFIGSTTSWFGQALTPRALCSSRNYSFSRWFFVWSSLYFSCSNVGSKASDVLIPRFGITTRRLVVEMTKR